jgi:hypothetical protein
MFFDIRSLIELLTSSLLWTSDTFQTIFAGLDMAETGAAPGRREFSAPNGMRACVYVNLEGRPERIEFPFALPDGLRGNPELIARYVEFVALPFKAELGEPNQQRHGDSRRWSWSLPTGTISVAPDETAADAVANVAWILEPPEKETASPGMTP